MSMRRKHRTAAHESATIRGKSPTPAAIRRGRDLVTASLRDLPEAELVPVARHGGLEVRGRRFGWLLIDHHGDGRLALNVKCSAILSGALKDALPEHFHIPKYVGNKGWIGLWLDLPGLRRDLLQNAVSEAYRLVAPKALLKQLP
jgi:predicted DNA-binding protein (MmcQ/YjbR family)